MAALQEQQRFCPSCQRLVLARRPGTNHILHLILTLLTCVWSIVWLNAAMRTSGGKWLCPLCGSEAAKAAK